MARWELIHENTNMSAGLHTPILYINDATNGLFIRVLLMVIWNLVTLGIFFAQKKAMGRGDFPMASAVGSFVTIVMTVIFGLVPGMIDPITYAVVIMVGLICVFWFLFSRE